MLIKCVLPEQVSPSRHLPHSTATLFTAADGFVNRTPGPSRIHATRPAPTRSWGFVARKSRSRTMFPISFWPSWAVDELAPCVTLNVRSSLSSATRNTTVCQWASFNPEKNCDAFNLSWKINLKWRHIKRGLVLVSLWHTLRLRSVLEGWGRRSENLQMCKLSFLLTLESQRFRCWMRCPFV